jgi:hypothetical protein
VEEEEKRREKGSLFSFSLFRKRKGWEIARGNMGKQGETKKKNLSK